MEFLQPVGKNSLANDEELVGNLWKVLKDKPLVINLKLEVTQRNVML